MTGRNETRRHQSVGLLVLVGRSQTEIGDPYNGCRRSDRIAAMSRLRSAQFSRSTVTNAASDTRSSSATCNLCANQIPPEILAIKNTFSEFMDFFVFLFRSNVIRCDHATTADVFRHQGRLYESPPVFFFFFRGGGGGYQLNVLLTCSVQQPVCSISGHCDVCTMHCLVINWYTNVTRSADM